MYRVMFATFGFLGFAFYQMSGGAEFNPDAVREARMQARETVEVAALEPAEDAGADAAPTAVVTQAATVQAEPRSEEPERIALKIASVDDVIAENRRTPRFPARRIPAAEKTGQAEELAEEPAPEVILPSLIASATPEQPTITPVTFGAEQQDPVIEAINDDIRAVNARRVNVRGGPGTQYSIVNKLTQGERVIVIDNPGAGWVMTRPVNGGTVGWMAESLLTSG